MYDTFFGVWLSFVLIFFSNVRKGITLPRSRKSRRKEAWPCKFTGVFIFCSSDHESRLPAHVPFSPSDLCKFYPKEVSSHRNTGGQCCLQGSELEILGSTTEPRSNFQLWFPWALMPACPAPFGPQNECKEPETTQLCLLTFSPSC